MNAATQIDEDSGTARDKINKKRKMETEKRPRSQKKLKEKQKIEIWEHRNSEADEEMYYMYEDGDTDQMRTIS